MSTERRSRRSRIDRTGLPEAPVQEPAPHAQHPARPLLRRRAGRQESSPSPTPECGQGRSLPRPGDRTDSGTRRKVKGVDALYGLAFHPQFAKNRYCYVCYILNSKNGEQLARRLARLALPRDRHRSAALRPEERKGPPHLAGRRPQRRRPALRPRRLPLHLHRRRLRTPTRPTRSTPARTSATCSRRSCASTSTTRTRARPTRSRRTTRSSRRRSARPEVWAYGFRNPWRMSFDRATGDLWVGDVGWELWEMVYRVKKGGNYGWSIMEGPQPVRAGGQARADADPAADPRFPAHRGRLDHRRLRLPRQAPQGPGRRLHLRRLGDAQAVGHEVRRRQDRLAQGDRPGHAAGRRLRRGHATASCTSSTTTSRARSTAWCPTPPPTSKQPDFPRKLSETGLFASVKDHAAAPASCRSRSTPQQWADHATAERLVALPGPDDHAKMYDTADVHPRRLLQRRQVFFPKDGVLAKTVSLEMERGNPKSRRRLETQILHFDGTDLARLHLRLERRADRRDPGAGGRRGPHLDRDATRRRPAASASRLALSQPGRVPDLPQPWAGYTPRLHAAAARPRATTTAASATTRCERWNTPA